MTKTTTATAPPQAAILDEIGISSRRIERRLDNLLDRMDDLERHLARMMGGVGHEDPEPEGPRGEELLRFRQLLRRMTPRQHGTLQLLLLGAQNEDIARVFGRDLSTAKTYVQGVCHLFGETRRAMVIAKAMQLWDSIGEDEYEATRGIPKDWGRRAMEALAKGEKADLDHFEERRGRMKTAA